jgi:hypothetical protein
MTPALDASVTSSKTQANAIESKIYLIRGFRVMLDEDLAGLYEVSTARLNEQVKAKFA